MNQLNHQEKQALYRLWKEEEAATFTGWDFSHLNGRCQDGELPWNYESMARSLLCPEKELLDMGTGGGEFLLTLGHPGVSAQCAAVPRAAGTAGHPGGGSVWGRPASAGR